MRHFVRSYNWKDYTFVLVCVVVYFLLMLQSYHISGDDLVFRFHQQKMEFMTSFNEVLESNVWNYFNSNGRFLAHVFIQYFLSIGSITAFYLSSSVMFGILLLAMLYLIRRNSTCIHGDACYMLVALSCLMPLMATLCYGTVAMTVNYMWSAAIYTLFLCVYSHIRYDRIEYSWWQNIILVLFAMICGSWQESFCIGIAGTLCIYHLITIRKTRGSLLYMLLGFGIGAAILVFAPSNFDRVAGGDVAAINLSSFVYQLIQIIKYNLFTILWIVIGVISIVIDLIKERKIRFVAENWLYFGSGSIAFIFTLFTIYKDVYQGQWQLTILSIWDVILLIRFIQYYCGEYMNKIAKFAVPILIVFLLSLYSYSYYHRNTMKVTMADFTESFLHNRPDTIYDGDIHNTIMNKVPNHTFLFEKICPIYIAWYDLEIFNRMARFHTNGENSWGTCILPEPIDSITQQCAVDGVAYLNPIGYSVVRYHQDSIPMDKTMQIYSVSKYPIDKLKDKLRHRHEKMMEYELGNMTRVSDGEYWYYIRYIDWWAYHNRRVTRITIANE